MNHTKHHHHTNAQSLEYAAILSGMALAGNNVMDDHIEQMRHSHQKNVGAGAISFNHIYRSGVAKR